MKKIILSFAMLAMICFSLVNFCNASQTQESELFSSILANDIVKVDQLIKDGVNVNSKGVNSFTPLLTAASGNRTEIALLLLKAGADPNLAGSQNETPLLYAVMTSNRILVKELMKRGADPNIKTAMGQSPLDMAKILHLDDIINMMIAEQTDVDKNYNISPEKTVLILINEGTIETAKADKENSDSCSYYLGSKGPTLLKPNVQPIFFRLITPYAALRYGFYRENKTFISFEKNCIDEIYKVREYAFVYVFPSKVSQYSVGFNYKNVVIRKNGNVYKSVPIKLSMLSQWEISPSQVWAFPIGLFDGEDIEIIGINAWEKQEILKVKGKKIKEMR